MWADGLGFIITLASILLIPAVAVYKVVDSKCQSEDTLPNVSERQDQNLKEEMKLFRFILSSTCISVSCSF